MGNLLVSIDKPKKKLNKYGSSKRIYIYPQYDKIKFIKNIEYIMNKQSKNNNYINEHLAKQILTQKLSDPTAIGKFNQKPNTPFDEKRKKLPIPKIKSHHVNISAIELNKLKNDLNILRQLLRIESDQKKALVEQIKKQQLDMLNSIKYYQDLNIKLQNKINKLNQQESTKPTKPTNKK